MSRNRYFILIAVVIAVARSVSRRRNSLSNEERVELEAYRQRERERAAHRPEKMSEPMLRCPHCGVFFPKSDGVRRADRVYCSARCRDADEAR